MFVSELSYEESVYPIAVQIYETYNPGAVVRIMACESEAGTSVDSGREK
jgi:F-box/leucine-rich repeat protein 4